MVLLHPPVKGRRCFSTFFDAGDAFYVFRRFSKRGALQKNRQGYFETGGKCSGYVENFEEAADSTDGKCGKRHETGTPPMG